MDNVLIGSLLENALNGKINISNPNVDFITRIGSIVKYKNANISYASDGAVQFVMGTIDNGRNWFVGDGPAIPLYENDYGLDFKNAVKKLVEKIVKYSEGNTIKFNLPVLARGGVETCILEVYNKLIIRYIEDYLPSVDANAKRFDIVLIKEKQNAN